jgi:hypothetical protein
LRLTEAQRKVVAEIIPEFAERLRLAEPHQRIVSFTRQELEAIHEQARGHLRRAGSGMKRNSLRHVIAFAASAVVDSQGLRSIPAGERIYQFKITLRDIAPPIWRRIQVRDGTLDRLHVHIQTALGWTNSHLHHFKFSGKHYADPWLLREDFGESGYGDSTVTRLSAVLPRSGERFTFEYEYDFGDCWRHEVLFEGCLRAAPGQRYPLCVEGARACPPEDSGGAFGYQEYIATIPKPEDEEYDDYVLLNGSGFDPEAFDAEKASRRMRRGLPNWRIML